MILGEESSLPMGETRNGASFNENDGFSLFNEEIINASTPRRGRSISYLELTSPYNETSLLSDTSLQRMRSLSQSINDLKILREKQQERKHEMGDLLDNDFLKEHARKLKDAREKIKRLEAKYQGPQRTRNKFDVWSLDGKRSSWLEEKNESLLRTENTGEEETDGYSGVTQEQNGITLAHPEVTTRRPRKPRPLTWASEEDFSSESNSMSSLGSNRQKIMEIIPENLDWNRNRCCGDEGTTTHHFTAREHSRSIPTTNATKWRSMPNLPTSQNAFAENRTFMHGEAIPFDPTSKKHQTKFTRKTGFYKVNETPGKCSTRSRSKKQKIREFFYRKSSSKSKKNSEKLVSSPKEALVLGRVVRCHPSIDTAYVIELRKPDQETFGFNIRKGYEERKDGVFICKIVDKRAEKFLGGLLRVGDEILEINNTNVREESLAFVQKLIQNAEKLELAILPLSSREEQ